MVCKNKMHDVREAMAALTIVAIETTTTRSDCLSAVCATTYIGHRWANGNTWIDTLSGLSAGSVVIGGTMFDMTSNIVGHRGFTDVTDNMIPGDRVYFASPPIPNYAATAKAMGIEWAYWNGENSVYMGGGWFMGLKSIYFPEIGPSKGPYVTETEMKLYVLQGYDHDLLLSIHDFHQVKETIQEQPKIDAEF